MLCISPGCHDNGPLSRIYSKAMRNKPLILAILHLQNTQSRESILRNLIFSILWCNYVPDVMSIILTSSSTHFYKARDGEEWGRGEVKMLQADFLGLLVGRTESWEFHHTHRSIQHNELWRRSEAQTCRLTERPEAILLSHLTINETLNAQQPCINKDYTKNYKANWSLYQQFTACALLLT